MLKADTKEVGNNIIKSRYNQVNPNSDLSLSILSPQGEIHYLVRPLVLHV